MSKSLSWYLNYLDGVRNAGKNREELYPNYAADNTLNEHETPNELLLPESYKKCKELVISAGFKREIEWQESVNIELLTESNFLQEYAWVTLSSGMKEQIIRNIFERFSQVFFKWESAKIISDNTPTCRQLALQLFANRNKVNAIITTSRIISKFGFPEIKKLIKTNPYDTLRGLPYIGPVTYFHLAKNIGIQVAKPDRHLTRFAADFGFPNVQELCSFLSYKTGDSIPVIDIVLWRYATFTKNAPLSFLRLLSG